MKISSVVINGQQCKKLSGADYWMLESGHCVTVREVKPDKFGSVRLIKNGKQVRRKLAKLVEWSFHDSKK